MKNENKDNEMYNEAKKRVAFKYHVLIYFIINLFLWTVWYISLKNNPRPVTEIKTVPWPVWAMLAWGIALLFHYLSAYKMNNKEVEDKFNKLKNKP
ncbi:MAG: 2TM domain-containing protein [Ginsengibacter sp.]